MPAKDQAARRPSWLPYVLLCLPLVFIVANCLRGLYCDLQLVQSAALSSEVRTMHAEAQLRSTGIQTMIEWNQAAEKTWDELSKEPWMQTLWSTIDLSQSRYVYAAVTDPAGRVVMHTDRQLVGLRLKPGWYDRRVPEAGEGVVYADGSPLSSESPAFDQSIPLIVGGKWIGDYRQGLDARWLDRSVAEQQKNLLFGWLWVAGIAAVVTVGAVWALVQLAREQRELAKSLQQGLARRSRQLTKIAYGLAHEVRNPLHALRINLHTLRHSNSEHHPLSPDQVSAVIDESDAEIDHLKNLIQDVLQFTTPSDGTKAELDVVREVRATLNLLSENMRSRRVEVRSELTQEPTVVSMEASRLRQLILNMMTFAQHNAGMGGVVGVQVFRQRGHVELAVTDSGPTLTDEQRANLFEPFEATSETGSSLGLALVQCFVEETGGTVECQSNAPSGCRIRVQLPLAAAF